MKVARWGNGLVVELPTSLVEELGLQDGDEVEVASGGPGRLEVCRDREAALARIRAMRVPLPPGYKFDRDEIYDRARGGFEPDPDYIDDK